MTKHIAFAGKGSSGKSTLMPFLIEACVATGARPLVVDADPNGTLTRLLGLAPQYTLGQLRSEHERTLATGVGLRPDETREEAAEKAMSDRALLLTTHFDLLALGHWELRGSNCTPVRVLDRALSHLANRYDYVLVDNEAGYEHIGRFAAHPLDVLILVALPEPEFLNVAAQCVQRVREAGRVVWRTELVLNRVRADEPLPEMPARHLPTPSLSLPESAALRALARVGQSPLALPAENAWRGAVATWTRALLGGDDTFLLVRAHSQKESY